MDTGTAGSVTDVRRSYRYRTLRKFRYNINTGTGHFGKFGTTSTPVPETSARWVRHPYRYREYRYHTEHTLGRFNGWNHPHLDWRSPLLVVPFETVGYEVIANSLRYLGVGHMFVPCVLLQLYVRVVSICIVSCRKSNELDV